MRRLRRRMTDAPRCRLGECTIRAASPQTISHGNALLPFSPLVSLQPALTRVHSSLRWLAPASRIFGGMRQKDVHIDPSSKLLSDLCNAFRLENGLLDLSAKKQKEVSPSPPAAQVQEEPKPSGDPAAANATVEDSVPVPDLVHAAAHTEATSSNHPQSSSSSPTVWIPPPFAIQLAQQVKGQLADPRWQMVSASLLDF